MRIEAVGNLTARLRARQAEIEQAALTRVRSVADSKESSDPEYTDGLRAAVTAALDYGIEAIERSEERPAPIPMVLLSQARLAARHGVKLETVLRRYLAGYTLLGDFLIEESEKGGSMDGASLKRLLRVQAALLDRLITAVSEEYAREAKARPGSAEQRRAELVGRLLAGERLDTSELAYDFEGNHLALLAKGAGAAEAIRELARPLDRRLMIVCREEGTVWAWLGGRRALDPEELGPAAASLPGQVSLASGEPGEGMGGWCLSHRQAKAALPIALRSPESFTRYADVALLASMLQDELLATSLREIYLKPLEEGRDGGEVARETLRAYFATGRNVSSAAAALGVNRNTAANRLRSVEQAIGRPLDALAAELEAVLRLEEFDSIASGVIPAGC
jgi:PucR-like helix-turn-helix protein/diguanylate cyclase with GGDEF domain